MMPIQYDNDYLQIVRHDFPTLHARDMFTYRLVGLMACYLDRETLAHCVESAFGEDRPKDCGSVEESSLTKEKAL